MASRPQNMLPFEVPPRRSSSYGSQISNPPADPPPPPPISAYISNAHRHLIASLNSSANSSPASSVRSSVRSSIQSINSLTYSAHPNNHAISQNSQFSVPFRTTSRSFTPTAAANSPTFSLPASGTAAADRVSAQTPGSVSLHNIPNSAIARRRRSSTAVLGPAVRSSSTAPPTLRPSAFPLDRSASQSGPRQVRELASARSMCSLRRVSSRGVLEAPFRPQTSMSERPLTAPLGIALPEPEPVTVANSVDAADQSHRLVVGVDFGTTYSAVAAAYSGTPDEIDIIKTWPGGNGITSDKVPTEIGYFAQTPSSTPTAKKDGKLVKWGFQFKPEESRLRCIKLFLDRNQELPHFVSRDHTFDKLTSLNLSVIDAVTDYLTEIYKHTIETLSRRYGEAFLSRTPIEFVLTVPAVWSDAAKAGTLTAAERAGMGNRHELRLISEPEAAAVYTLKAIQPNHLKIGDNFIVCDAGGGTVDLIAYTILQLEPLRVEESAVGDGGLCGSAFLNYRFEEQVKCMLGPDRYSTLREKKPKSWNMGLKYFEEFVKRNYNDTQPEMAEEVCVPFPGLPDDENIGLADGFLTIRHDQIKAIFDPVVSHVISLVQTQVDRIQAKGGSISGIILVGGFGQSNYLYEQMKLHFQPTDGPVARTGAGLSSGSGEQSQTDWIANHDTPGALSPAPSFSEFPTPPSLQLNGISAADVHSDSIEVMHPMYAWTAVVRGAVIRGLEGGMVISRKSRYHYGTSYATVYDERAHKVVDRYWSPLWERWMVSDRMQWHIAKGQQLSENEPISFHYTRNFRPGQSLVVTDDLIACVEDMPPESCAGLDMSRKPLHSRDTSTQEIKTSMPPSAAEIAAEKANGNAGAESAVSREGLPPSSSRTGTQNGQRPNGYFPIARTSISSILSRTSISPASSPALSSHSILSPQTSSASSPSPQTAKNTQFHGSDRIVQLDAPPMELASPPDSALASQLIHVCTLTTDLAAVPKKHFTRLTTTSGIVFDNLDFALNMRVESAGLVFDLTVDGIKYGSVVAEFH